MDQAHIKSTSWYIEEVAVTSLSKLLTINDTNVTELQLQKWYNCLKKESGLEKQILEGKYGRIWSLGMPISIPMAPVTKIDTFVTSSNIKIGII